jgi:hypothetical protein
VNYLGAESSHLAIGFHILFGHELRFSHESFSDVVSLIRCLSGFFEHSLDSPKQVPGCGSRRSDETCGPLNVEQQQLSIAVFAAFCC